MSGAEEVEFPFDDAGCFGCSRRNPDGLQLRFARTEQEVVGEYTVPDRFHGAPGIAHGGIMATGGNLVFQGNAEGDFVAYAADTGERIWSVQTGSAINAAPASYWHEDQQFVVIPIGVSGGLQNVYPEMHAADRAKGPVRLMAFSLSGGESMPDGDYDYPPLPEQPALEAAHAAARLLSGRLARGGR